MDGNKTEQRLECPLHVQVLPLLLLALNQVLSLIFLESSVGYEEVSWMPIYGEDRVNEAILHVTQSPTIYQGLRTSTQCLIDGPTAASCLSE